MDRVVVLTLDDAGDRQAWLFSWAEANARGAVRSSAEWICRMDRWPAGYQPSSASPHAPERRIIPQYPDLRDLLFINTLVVSFGAIGLGRPNSAASIKSSQANTHAHDFCVGPSTQIKALKSVFLEYPMVGFVGPLGWLAIVYLIILRCLHSLQLPISGEYLFEAFFES